MKRSLLGRLRCPTCQGSLQLHAYKSIATEEVIDGVLTCTCGAAFIVRGGVPCMVPSAHIPAPFVDDYRKRLQLDAPSILVPNSVSAAPEFSFSWQWDEHSYDDLTWELKLGERVQLFYRYIGLSPTAVQHMTMLDAGCGNGTLSAELALQGIEVIGLDFSDGPLRAYQYQVFQSRVTEAAAGRLDYVQGDLQEPPFQDGAFDLIYADGVLHHTPDTRRTFMAVAPKVKAGGRFSSGSTAATPAALRASSVRRSRAYAQVLAGCLTPLGCGCAISPRSSFSRACVSCGWADIAVGDSFPFARRRSISSTP